MANDIKTFPFRGGVNTKLHKTQLPSGVFSTLQNVRSRHPGFEQRRGQIKHHSTASGVLSTPTLYSFVKSTGVQNEIFRQLSDGSVQVAADAPPTVTTGVYGTEVLASIANTKAASWSTLGDRVLFSDSIRQHQIYGGSGNRISEFKTYEGSGVWPRIPTLGKDFTPEITDTDLTTTAVLGALTSPNDAIFVMNSVRLNTLEWITGVANTLACVASVEYWNGGAYVAVAGLVDGSASAGKTLAVDGDMSWTLPTDEQPNYLFGRSGFWYRIVFSSGGLSATTSIATVTGNEPWQDIQNVWSGALVPAVEVQLYHSGITRYFLYSGLSVNMSSLPAGDFCYFSSVRPLTGVRIDTGVNPHIAYARVIGADISFLASGSTADDQIKRQGGDFLSAGFETGMSITISGSTSNNITTTILLATSGILYVAAGVLTDEAIGASVTILYNDGVPTYSAVEVWNGTAWVTVGTVEDTTAGLTESGFLMWNRSLTGEKLQFNESAYYAYWYRLSLSKKMSNSVLIGIETLPFHDMSTFGKGVCNAAWKSRVVYSFDEFPSYLYISASDFPLTLNGADYAILEAGDGRNNSVKAARTFHNELMVWQEEKGEAGGCTTLIEGYSPTTFGRLVLSTQIGIVNAKCAVVVDGVLTATKTEEMLKTLAFWISRSGIAMSDGRLVTIISDEIQNYFDPSKAECITKGAEDRHWLAFDSAENVIRIGLCSNSLTPNIFPVYDLVDKTWSFDKLGQPLECMVEVESGSSTTPVRQFGGGVDDGFVYQLNVGLDDVALAVESQVILEFNGEGGRLSITEAVLQVDSQTTGDIVTDVAINGVTTFSSPKTLSMISTGVGAFYRRHRYAYTAVGEHLSLRFTHSGTGEGAYFLSLGLAIGDLDNNV